jgi:hypothetical protein
MVINQGSQKGLRPYGTRSSRLLHVPVSGSNHMFVGRALTDQLPCLFPGHAASYAIARDIPD